MRKYLVTCLLIFCSVAIFPLQTSAQEYFSCEGAAGECVVNQNSRCFGSYPSDPNSPEQIYCSQFDTASCDSTTGICQTCDSPYECFDSNCPQNYTDYTSNFLCASPTARCCLSDAITPPPSQNCYRCIFDYGNDICALTPFEPNGSCMGYTTFLDCDNNCPPTSTTTYSCIQGSYQCTPSSTGTYTDYYDCMADCTPSQTQNQCIGASGDPGECFFLFCNPPSNYIFDGWNPTVPIEDCGSITCGFDASGECVVSQIGCTSNGTYYDGMCENDLDCLNSGGGPLIQSCICPSSTTPACTDNSTTNQLYVCCVPIEEYENPERPPLEVRSNPATGDVCDDSYKASHPNWETLCTGINTAVGAIDTSDTTNLSSFVIRLGIGLGGGIAFLLIIFAGLQFMTSSGDPEKMKSAKNLLGAAIGGLLLIIFSVFILEMIGVRILQLPGF